MAQPAPLPLRRPIDGPNNLPAQITSFVGREVERDEIGHLLRESTRLVTLTGAGGVGKTRLALEVASDVLGTFGDGVWLVELAPVSDARRVLPSIAASLGIHDGPGQELLDTLTVALRFRHLLMVLDNCEHVIDACADVAHRLLSASRRLTILATSREPLGVTGETVWRLASLEQSHSERLFVDRASAALHSVDLTWGAEREVAQICQRLDGIPLALELAAARVPALGLDEILTRLDDRFELLVKGSRTAPPRQQTLRAVVEWSYDLLGDDERSLFQSLSVFSGGWSLAAAEWVVVREAHDERSAVEGLMRLVDKSLVIAEVTPVGTRYRMLETVRAYAAEKLRAAGAESALRDRHLEWYAAQAQRAEHLMRRALGVSWAQRIECASRLRQDMDNLRAAWRWSLEGGEIETGLRMAVGLFPFFYTQGFIAEGREWLFELLKRTASSQPTRARAEALSAATKLAVHHGDGVTAERLAEEYLSQPDSVRTVAATADVHTGLSICAFGRGDAATARMHANRSLALSRQMDDGINAGFALGCLGWVAFQESDLETATTFFQQALDEARGVDFQLVAALALVGLANVMRARANPAAARSMYEEALAIFQAMGATMQAGEVRLGLGYTALDEDDCAQAARHFGEAAELLSSVGQQRLLASALEGLARATSAQRDLPPSQGRADGALTDRERQVARLLARGLTNREIACELVISNRTVDRHVENILAKLGFSSRATVAAWAAQNGLLA